MKPVGIQVVLVEPGSFETDIWTRNRTIAEGLLRSESPNAGRLARWRAVMETSKPRANAQVVADGIAAILDNPRPGLRYVFGRDGKMGVWLKRLLPWSLLERLLIKASGMDQ